MAESRTVALCTTCIVDQIMPEVGVAAVKVLRRAGVRVEFPAGQTCCGQPFFNSGHLNEARASAKHTIAVFEAAAAVVLPGGSCATMIRKEYPHLFEDYPAWKARAEALAHKTYELTEYLSEVVDWQPASVAVEAAAVTYHDSCHMTRMLNIRQSPRAALQRAGVAVVEMPESDRCCGFGGLFCIKMPEVSNAMTRQKLTLAVKSGAKTLVVSDPGCLMQMRGFSHETELRLRHTAEVLEEATR